MQMSENQKLITVAEMAAKLGVTSQTIRNYITSGAVKAVKIGNRTYIDKQALSSVLDQLSDVEGMSRNISRLKGRLAKEEKALRTRLAGLEAPNSVLYFLNRVRYSKELMESVVYSLGYRHLTDRQLKCLHNADIDTIGDLVEYERTDLLKFRNFGKKSLNELDDVLESLNLEWGMDFTDLKNRYADYISKNKKYKTEVYDKA